MKIVAAPLLLSCGDDEGLSPALESVAGVYHATFTTPGTDIFVDSIAFTAEPAGRR